MNKNYTFLGFQPECFICWLRRGHAAIKNLSDNRHLQLKVIQEVAKRLGQLPLGTPYDPAFIYWFQKYISQVTGGKDPWGQIKKNLNQMALQFYPLLKEHVSRSRDPLLTAAILAGAGNILDEVDGSNFSLEKSIASSLEEGFKYADYQEFKNLLSGSRRVLYVADNAGEIVFDRLLLEEISNHQITYVVKGSPLSSDVTIEDAKFAGIDAVANVVSTEVEYPLRIVGSKVKELAHALDKADVIISKGQLNYGRLTYQLERSAFYLVRIKCNNFRESFASKGNFAIGEVVLIQQ
ncbi:MAG: ARMT1-like domain-containing protein [Desulfotomaculaceae bacterium]|nr:ARMT1-like domain-containing protein [Desulfotomaculaceae bacterium]